MITTSPVISPPISAKRTAFLGNKRGKQSSVMQYYTGTTKGDWQEIEHVTTHFYNRFVRTVCAPCEHHPRALDERLALPSAC